MRNENFDIPVTVETDAAGRERVVTDTIQAAEILLRRWPDDGRGQKYKAALRACMDAMEQRRAVASARRPSLPPPRTRISSSAPAAARTDPPLTIPA